MTDADDAYGEMTYAELTAEATARGIDVHGGLRRDDLTVLLRRSDRDASGEHGEVGP